MKKYVFTEQEKKQVEQAVQELEKESCGEIVPFFVRKSDDYDETSWFFAFILTIAAIGVLALLSYIWILPSISYVESFVIVVACSILGYFIPIISPNIKRILIGRDRALHMCSLRANEAFLNEQVFATEERVGILIFVSRLEHIVIVQGDEGINKKLNQEDWEEVVQLIVAGIKGNQIGKGFVDGIHRCKELLLANGFTRKSTDTNELSDGLRIEDE